VETFKDDLINTPIFFCGDYQTSKPFKMFTELIEEYFFKEGKIQEDDNVVVDNDTTKKQTIIYAKPLGDYNTPSNKNIHYIKYLCNRFGKNKYGQKYDNNNVGISGENTDLMDISVQVKKKIQLIKSTLLKEIYDNKGLIDTCKYFNLDEKNKCGSAVIETLNQYGERINDNIILGYGNNVGGIMYNWVYDENICNLYKMYMGAKFTKVSYNNVSTIKQISQVK
jgi:hypothetical protein